MAKPSKTTPSKERASNFEEALKRLEEIVETLELGEAPLEESLALFEEGVGLARRCQHLLDAANRRITQLVGEGDDVVEVDMETGEVLEDDNERG